MRPCQRRGLLAALVGLLLLSVAATEAAVQPQIQPAGCGNVRMISPASPPLLGPDIQHLQEMLLELGRQPGPLDGIYGPRTAQAVRTFQRQAGLPADGHVGPQTLSALEESLQGLPHAPFVPPGKTDRVVLVNTRIGRLTLLVGGYPARSYTVAVGRNRTPSPVGYWKVIRKARDWGDGFGTRWLGLNVPWGMYGIHGTDKPWMLGSRVSAGCIRMQNQDVEELYDLVPVGTPVMIYGDLVLRRRTLVEGHTGADVMELQQRLHELNWYLGPVDGRFGPGTAAAVRRFQRHRGLPATGEVRWNTLKALGMIP